MTRKTNLLFGDRFLARFNILPWTLAVSWHYGQLFRYLSDQDRLIRTNDLLISDTAIAHSVPLVTSNERYIARAPALDVRTYP